MIEASSVDLETQLAIVESCNDFCLVNSWALDDMNVERSRCIGVVVLDIIVSPLLAVCGNVVGRKLP